jgi:spermidine synthase
MKLAGAPFAVCAARRVQGVALLAIALVLGLSPGRATRGADAEKENFAGRLEADQTSEFSHIRIRRSGDVRSMLFVRDNGEEWLESRINLKSPHVLQFDYLKHLFASYLFCNPQQDVLIVGLGGGGQIHFLQHYDAAIKIDAVEIDPLVVKLADQYFSVRKSETVNIVTADGLKFIAETPKKYDVIYLDAFLKPSADTDATGVPLALRTKLFYEQLQTKLKPGGVAAFNINPHAAVREDVAAITAAFPQAYEFQLPRRQGTVVVASTDAKRVTLDELLKRADALDPRFEGTIRLKEIARRLRN